MSAWSIEVITERKPDPDTMILFSMIPGEAERESDLEGELFWGEVKRKLLIKTGLHNMPSGVVDAYIRDARRNPGNRVALLVKY